VIYNRKGITQFRWKATPILSKEPSRESLVVHVRTRAGVCVCVSLQALATACSKHSERELISKLYLTVSSHHMPDETVVREVLVQATFEAYSWRGGDR